jgi:hypothetical protein
VPWTIAGKNIDEIAAQNLELTGMTQIGRVEIVRAPVKKMTAS